MSRLRRGTGTMTPRPIDTPTLGRAVAQPGIDPRQWVSYGTVCVLNEDGTFDFEDPRAVYTSPDGVSVDVLLHPAMQHVTCRYPGLQGGASGSVYAPIRPGDEVLVEIPDGDMRQAPVITKVMSGEHSRLPLGDDRKPIWRNDRILVYGNGNKVHIKVTGGAEVVVNVDGSVEVTGTKVTLGEADATEQLVKGTTYRSAEAKLNDAATGLQFQFTSLASAATGAGPPVAALAPSFTAIAGLFQVFEAQSGQFLSDVSKTK